MDRTKRREVRSRLEVLMSHLLKWKYQTRKRTESWRRTIKGQRKKLEKLIRCRLLSIYAEKTMAEAYRRAVKKAANETGLPKKTFPEYCPYELDDMIDEENT